MKQLRYFEQPNQVVMCNMIKVLITGFDSEERLAETTEETNRILHFRGYALPEWIEEAQRT